MYTDFYNLKEKPFNLNPSSRFLYLGEIHKEALALLTYGVTERKGFVLLTGEVGTGKTTIIQALFANLDENTQYVYLSNPLFYAKDFINYLAFSVFKKNARFDSKAEFLIEFEDFLRDCLQHQKNFVLIIDEAHTLTFELLEEIRLLSNMETADEKLINIFLVGQPELNEKLSQPRCRPLLQRISIRYHIKALDLEGAQEYIEMRLKIAGAKNGDNPFSKAAVKAIHQYSEGYPRMINILADNVLLLGYSRGKRKILPSMVTECYEDLQLKGTFSKGPASKPDSTEIKSKEPPHQISHHWKWAAVLFFMIAISVIAMIWHGKNVSRRLAARMPASHQTAPDDISREQISAKEIIDNKIQDVVKSSSEETQKALVDETVDNKWDERKTIPPEMPVELEGPVSNKGKEPQGTTITTKKGDTLLKLAMSVYGRSDEHILNLVHKHNPEIEDLNHIAIDQKIIFPPLSESIHGPIFTVHIASFKPFEYAQDLFQVLLRQGYEAYIIPAHDSQEGNVYRVTLGDFKNVHEAKDYAAEILKNNISDYAKVIRLEMR